MYSFGQNEIYLAFLQAVRLNSKVVRRYSELKDKKPAKTHKNVSKNINDFMVAEGFLMSKKMRQECMRIEMGGFSIRCPETKGICSLTERININVYATIFPTLEVGLITYNMAIKYTSVDEIIFIRQCFEGRYPLEVFDIDFRTIPININKSNKKKTHISWNPSCIGLLKDILKFNIIEITQSLNAWERKERFIDACLIEIRPNNDSKISNPQQLIESSSGELYGLITGDEGWRSVPLEVSQIRISNDWTTRDFLRVISFHDTVLMINMCNSSKYVNYCRSQKQLTDFFGKVLDPYFELMPNIAGLNHGPLFALENTLAIRLLINDYWRARKVKLHGIKDFLHQRNNLIDVIEKISFADIKELNILLEQIQRSFSVDKDMKSLQLELEQLERSLIVKYNQRINTMIIALTATGVIVSVVGLLYSIMK